MVAKSNGAPSRGRTGTPLFRKAADFKSAVSTNFTIGAPATVCAIAWQRNPDVTAKQRPIEQEQRSDYKISAATLHQEKREA